MKYRLFAAASLLVTGPAWADSDAAKRFGAREDVEQISLSPDGARVAFLEPVGASGTAVNIIDIKSGAQTTAVSASGYPDQIAYCRWSTNIRLVCRLAMATGDNKNPSTYARMIAVDADGKNLKMLSVRTSENALQTDYDGGTVIDWASDGGSTVLMARNYVPEVSTGSFTRQTRSGYGVERLDTVTLKRTPLESPRLGAVEYITDGRGIVRIMGVRGTTDVGYDKNATHYLYRKVGSRTWEDLSTVTSHGSLSSGFDPYAVDPDHNVAYGFDAIDGHQALFSVALDGSLKHSLVLGRSDVDVDGLLRVGRHNRVVGASFATDRRRAEFFDPTLKQLGASLAKALPGLPLVSFVDATANESKLLLFAGSDVDPGHYYLYDKASHKLDEVSAVRPQLGGLKLAAVKSISYPAADGTMIPAYLTLPVGSDGKNLSAIVMPHGGPEDRDEWGFDWLSQYFANRGYAVLQPNFRGSTGYGEAWFKKNGFQSWRTAVGDVNDGGHWLIKSGIAKADALAIVGWSYGGYAALQSTVIDPDLFKAVVAIAPLTDFESWRQQFSDYSNFTNVDARVGHGPHVREGSPAQNAARITAPVLIFHGDRDQNVAIGESRLMTARLKAADKPVELVEFHNLAHQLDDSNARSTMLDKADIFLRTSMHLPDK